MKFFNYSFDSPAIWDWSISHNASFLKSCAFDILDNFSAVKLPISPSLSEESFLGLGFKVMPFSLIFCIIFWVSRFIRFWILGLLWPNSSYDPIENVGSSSPPSSIFSFSLSSLEVWSRVAGSGLSFKDLSLGTELRLVRLRSVIEGSF